MGGKGANQAVAAARLGADVRMIGAVGDDGFSYEMLTKPRPRGRMQRYSKTVQGYSSGIANITVAGGENSIVAVSGANFALTPEDVLRTRPLPEAMWCSRSSGIPMECVITAAKLAQKHGRPFVLNPRAGSRAAAELLELTTLLTPNTYELAASLGLPQDMSAEELISRSPLPRVDDGRRKRYGL